MPSATLSYKDYIFDDIEFSFDDSVEVFQFQVYSLTGVPPQSQKLMGFPGGPLKPGKEWSDINPKNDGTKLILFGPSEDENLAREQCSRTKGMPKKSPSLEKAEEINHTPATVSAAASLPKKPSTQHMNPAEMSAFQNRILFAIKQTEQYEDERLHALALSLMPADFQNRILRRKQSDNIDEREACILELLQWFKHEFFTWTNEPKCSSCGGPTNGIGAAHPNPEERKWMAGHVEVYKCECGALTRFPRYNHVEKLLETRTGRCGEWVQAFALFCRANDFDTRVAHDFTDHVWVEVFSVSSQNWVHADPCEAAYDSPLMYENGWGKKLTYVISVCPFEVVDTTRRYSNCYHQVLERRTQVSEEFVASFCIQMRQALLPRVPDSMQQFVRSRQQMELSELSIIQTKRLQAAKNPKPEEALPRQSGSLAWRRQRGEMGACTSQSTSTDSSSSTVDDHSTKENGLSVLEELGSWMEQCVGDDTTRKSLVKLSTEQLEEGGSAASQSSVDLLGCAAWGNKGSGNGLVLTECTNDATGGVALSIPQVGMETIVFAMTFCMNQHGADGMAVVLSGEEQLQSLGAGGACLGAQGLHDCIVIELDSFSNQDTHRDPSFQHIALFGTPSPSQAVSLVHSSNDAACERVNDLNDGMVHGIVVQATRAQAQHSHANSANSGSPLRQQWEVSIWLDGQQNPLMVAACFGPSSIRTVAVTAATGGLSQRHCVSSLLLAQARGNTD